MAPAASLAALSQRLDAVLQRLAQLELQAGLTPADALAARQLAILHRLQALEAAAGIASPAAAAAVLPASLPAALATPAAPPSAALPATWALPEVAAVDASGSEVQQRLQAELLERGLRRHRFVRAPPEYYDRPLEFRWASFELRCALGWRVQE